MQDSPGGLGLGSLSNFKTQIECHEKTISALQTEMIKLKAENESLRKQMHALTQELAAVTVVSIKATEDFRSQLAQLNIEINGLRAQLPRLPGAPRDPWANPSASQQFGKAKGKTKGTRGSTYDPSSI